MQLLVLAFKPEPNRIKLSTISCADSYQLLPQGLPLRRSKMLRVFSPFQREAKKAFSLG